MIRRDPSRGGFLLVFCALAGCDESTPSRAQQDAFVRQHFERQAEAAKREMDREVNTNQLKDELEDKTREVQRLQQELADLRAQLGRQATVSPRTDGELRVVDLTTKTAWVDVGSENNLAPGQLFQVFAPGDLDSPSRRKGSIEITEVISPRLSQARIIDSDPSRPLAAGDVLRRIGSQSKKLNPSPK